MRSCRSKDFAAARSFNGWPTAQVAARRRWPSSRPARPAARRALAVIELAAAQELCGTGKRSLPVPKHELASNHWQTSLASGTRFYPPAAAALGIDLERLILLRPANEADHDWAVHQGALLPGGGGRVVLAGRQARRADVPPLATSRRARGRAGAAGAIEARRSAGRIGPTCNCESARYRRPRAPWPRGGWPWSCSAAAAAGLEKACNWKSTKRQE